MNGKTRANPLSETAVDGFRKFQENVPFVALTTMQMREAAERGTLDGFILEYQSYQNDSALSRNYKFTPFGYRHDNPLVSVGKPVLRKRKSFRCLPSFVLRRKL